MAKQAKSPRKSTESISYKDAGVDLELYGEAMARLPRLMHRTYSPRVLDADGGFAGLFRLDYGNRLFKRNYKDPVLVSGTDGVGTKLKIAQMLGQHDTVGIDLVAMCVNDVICCGAEPLFFLDYVAMSHDDPKILEQIVTGISEGCIQADCALLGGETAIMPDLYQAGDYDLAGFNVGVVERRALIDGKTIAEGDLVVGLASTGVHSNGFSLVRKTVFEAAGHSLDDEIDDFGHTVGQELIRPTQIYVRAVRKVLGHYKVKGVVHGIAHITGGGMQENIERILPKHVDVQIRDQSWEVPKVFDWLQKLGNIDPVEMFRVFNMGIGMVLIVSPYYTETVQRIIGKQGIDSWLIGEVVTGAGDVRIAGIKRTRRSKK